MLPTGANADRNELDDAGGDSELSFGIEESGEDAMGGGW